jgi:uncharacterized RDD family membrane protein YckC
VSPGWGYPGLKGFASAPDACSEMTVAPAHAAPLTGPSLDNRRIAAAAIDLLVLLAFGIVLGMLAGAHSAGTAMVSLAWALYYYFALEMLAGQTLGKKAMGLKVVRADGRQADPRTIAVRTVLRLIDGIGLYLVGLVVMLVTGERRQRLGDLAADTVVTNAEEDVEDPTVQMAPAPTTPPGSPISALAEPAGEPAPPVAEPTAPVAEPPTVPEPPPAVEPEPVVPDEPAPVEVAPPPPAVAPEPEEPLAERPDKPVGDLGFKLVSPIDFVMEDDESADEKPPPPPGGQAA